MSQIDIVAAVVVNGKDVTHQLDEGLFNEMEADEMVQVLESLGDITDRVIDRLGELGAAVFEESMISGASPQLGDVTVFDLALLALSLLTFFLVALK